MSRWFMGQALAVSSQLSAASPVDSALVILLFYFVDRRAPQLTQRLDNHCWRESLPHQVLIEPGILGRIGRLWPSAQLLLERSRHERALVLLAKDLADGSRSHVLVDAPGLQLAHHSQASSAFDLHRCSGIGGSQAPVVE